MAAASLSGTNLWALSLVPVGDVEAGAESMTQSVYNIVKAPLGWLVFCDGVKTGGIYGSKEAALEAAAVAAALAVRDGAGVQINVPSAGKESSR
jgi:hypothetical protein